MTHHHHPGHSHPAAAIRPSMLRQSVGARLIVAVVAVAAIWATVWGALA